MNNGWHTDRLDNLAVVRAGNSAPQAKGLFVAGTHPFFRTSDVGRIHVGEIREAASYLNDQGIKGLRRFPKGTILFPKSGASTFLNHRVMLGVEGFVSSHLAAIVADKTQLEPRFLLYFLTKVAAQDMIQDQAYPSLNLPSIEGIQVSYPDLPEQQRIVVILDEAFDAIATARANTEQNLRNAREVFESQLRSIFASGRGAWVERKLGDRAVVQSGGTPPVANPTYWNGDIPWYSSGELNGFTTGPPSRYITRAGLDASNAKLFPAGSLLIGMYDTAALKMSILDREGAFNQAIAGVKPTPDIDLGFVLYAVAVKKPKLLLERRGVRQKNLSLAKIKDIRIPWPKRPEQRAIAAEIRRASADCDRLAVLCGRKLAALDELRQSILHQAFSGAL